MGEEELEVLEQAIEDRYQAGLEEALSEED